MGLLRGAKNLQNVSGAVVQLGGQNTDIKLIIHSWRNLHNGDSFPVDIQHKPVYNYLDTHKAVHVTHLKTKKMICCENISTDRRRHPHNHGRNVWDNVQSLENRGRPQKRTWVTARSRIHMQESRPDDCQVQTTVRDRPKSAQCRLESAKQLTNSWQVLSAKNNTTMEPVPYQLYVHRPQTQLHLPDICSRTTLTSS